MKMVPLAHNDKFSSRARPRARERKLIEGFERPIRCYFCGELVTKLKGQGAGNLAIHSLDGNHENWDPANKVPTHIGCHTRYHDLERPSGPDHYSWKGGTEASLNRTRDQRLERSRSQRRHRLHGEEIPEVMKALALLLRQYVREEKNLEAATVAFMPFYRMLYHRTGRPNYPEPITWNNIVEALNWYRLARAGKG